MASPFADLEKLVSDQVDSLYGERTRIVRKVAGQYFSRAADGERTPVDTIGVVDFNPVMARPQDLGQYDGYQPQVAADRIHVSYQTGAFASAAAYPAANDEVWLLEPEREGQKLRISRVDPDGLGRLVCVCVPA